MKVMAIASAAILLATTAGYCGQREDQLRGTVSAGKTVKGAVGADVAGGKFALEQYDDAKPAEIKPRDRDRDVFERIMGRHGALPVDQTAIANTPPPSFSPDPDAAQRPAPRGANPTDMVNELIASGHDS